MNKMIITLVITIAMVFTMTVPAFADEVAQSNGLLQVTGVTATNYSTTSLKLYWNEVKGAESYQVYGATSKSGKYYLKKTTSSLSYVNPLLTCGKTYYYKVRAVGAGSYGAYSNVVSKKVQPK
ncbi:MAG: fibronectin type III domain-containing protein [Anaerovoracaceae bacterium]